MKVAETPLVSPASPRVGPYVDKRDAWGSSPMISPRSHRVYPISDRMISVRRDHLAPLRPVAVCQPGPERTAAPSAVGKITPTQYPANDTVSDLRTSLLGTGREQADAPSALNSYSGDYLYVDDEVEVKQRIGAHRGTAVQAEAHVSPEDAQMSEAVAQAVAKVENEIAMEKRLIIQEAERLRSHVQNTRAEVLRRRQERTRLTNEAIDTTNEGMRQLYERMKLTSCDAKAEVTSPSSPSPIKISSPEGKQLSSTIQDLRVSLLAAAACDEAEEPISAESTTTAKQAVQQAEACLYQAEHRIQQLQEDVKLKINTHQETVNCSSSTQDTEASVPAAERTSRTRSGPRPNLGVARRVTREAATEQPVEVSSPESEPVQQVSSPEEIAESFSPGAHEEGSATDPSQVLLPKEDLSEVNEKVVAGALLAISRELAGSSQERCASILSALEATAFAVKEAQGEVVGACPRCTTLLAVNLDVICQVLQLNLPACEVLPHSCPGHVIPVPLGAHRLMAAEMVLQLICVYSVFTDSHLISSGVMSQCFQLFFQYPKSSLLHTAIRNIFDAVLASPNEAIKTAMLQGAHEQVLAAQIADAGTAVLAIPPGSRPVNTGHVIEMSQILAESEDAVIKDALSKNIVWAEYVRTDGVLGQLLAQQQGGPCGGAAPAIKSADSWNGPEGEKQCEADMQLLMGSMGNLCAGGIASGSVSTA